MRDRTVDATSPAMSERASPWKIGSNRMTLAPTTTAAAVKSIGRKRTAPASTTASSSDMPCERRNSIKSRRELWSDDDSGARDETIIGRGEECTHQRVRGQDADQSWRNWRHDYQRRLKILTSRLPAHRSVHPGRRRARQTGHCNCNAQDEPAPCSGFRAWAARLSQLHKFLANEKPCQVQANTYRVGTLPGNLGHFLVGQSFHVAQDKNNPVRREPLPAIGCP